MPLQIIRKDITQMHVDAIVNTTNKKMIGYSGVDLAIHRAAGPELDEECASLAPLGLGCAKITKGYGLDAKYIIHTSGPVWKGGLAGESIILKSCYLESLKLAAEYGCGSVAFPLISSGVYGYPKDRVLKFAVEVISDFLLDHEMQVYICVFDRTSYEFSRELFGEICEAIGSTDEICANSEQLCCNWQELDYEELTNVQSHYLRENRDRNKIRKLSESPCIPETDESASCVEKNEKDTLQTEKKLKNTEKVSSCEALGKSLEEYLKKLDKTFANRLFDLIDERGMTDVECYKKANIDRKTFSKIRSNPDTYKPSKPTAVAFAIALRLNLDETQQLLATAGLTLSRSFTFDKIIIFFINKGVYDINEINMALFEFDQACLGF